MFNYFNMPTIFFHTEPDFENQKIEIESFYHRGILELPQAFPKTLANRSENKGMNVAEQTIQMVIY